MAKNDFQYGGWNYYTLQCGMWLWNHDSEFTKWQHPAMWYVALGWHIPLNSPGGSNLQCDIALGSWHWICQVAAPCNVAGGSGMTCHGFARTSAILEVYIWFWFWPYHRSRVHVILYQSPKFCANQITLGIKNDVISIFKMADLGHVGSKGSNNGFFEKPMYVFL